MAQHGANRERLSEVGLSVHDAFDSNPHAAQFRMEPPKQRKPKTAEEKELAALMDRCVAQIQQEGFVIIEDVLSPQQLRDIRAGIEAEIGPAGRNNFEGHQTQRVYSMSSKQREIVNGKSTSVFDDAVLAPKVLGVLDRLLLPNYLLTAYQAIHICPGETRQPYHHDDQFVNVPRPRRAFSYGVIMAIDDFTAENGGTIVFPRSHLWGDQLPPEDLADGTTQGVPTVMKAGSAIVFSGTLWHAGGPNTSKDKYRMAVTTQYCEPWMRPQENFMLSMPWEHARLAPPRLQSLIGYNIHPPFIGHVNGEHPLKHLAKL